MPQPTKVRQVRGSLRTLITLSVIQETKRFADS